MQRGHPVSLRSKLALLRLRGRKPDGPPPPSTRAIAAASAESPGGKPVINYQTVNDYLNGDKDNPTAAQIMGLARALKCPPAYLLPAYNDLTALTVFDRYPETREALRLVHDLGEAGASELLEAARLIRSRHGKDDLSVPEVPLLEESNEPPRPGRPRRRRLSFDEAAQRAVSDLEGP